VLSRTGVLANSGQTLVVALPFAAVGALVAWRRPGNPLGWLMLAGGVMTRTRRQRHSRPA
jgi:hypothetical protein